MGWRATAVSSEEVQQWYTKSRVLYVGKVTSQSALFSLFKTQFLAHRPMFLENPASSFDLYNVCSIRSLAIHSVNSLTVPSLSCIKWFRCARCFSFREVTLQSCLCFIGYGWIGVHRWRLAVFQISFIFILPCYASLHVGIYLIVLSFIPSLPSSRLIYLSCTTSNFEFFLKISWSDNRASLVTYTSICLRIGKSIERSQWWFKLFALLTKIASYSFPQLSLASKFTSAGKCRVKQPRRVLQVL